MDTMYYAYGMVLVAVIYFFSCLGVIKFIVKHWRQEEDEDWHYVTFIEFLEMAILIMFAPLAIILLWIVDRSDKGYLFKVKLK